jgi:hypothetical protein
MRDELRAQFEGAANPAPPAQLQGQPTASQGLPSFIPPTQRYNEAITQQIYGLLRSGNPQTRAEGYKQLEMWTQRLNEVKQVERGNFIYAGNDYQGYRNTGIPSKPDVKQMNIKVGDTEVPRLAQYHYNPDGSIAGYTTLPEIGGASSGAVGQPGAANSVVNSDTGTPEMRRFIDRTRSVAPQYPTGSNDPNEVLKFGTAHKEYERSGENFQKQAERIADEAHAAKDDQTQLQLLERVLQHPSLMSGTGSTTLAMLNDAARQVGLSKGEWATWRQIAEKLGSRQQVADVRNTTIGQGTAVRMAEADAIKNSQFSLERTPGANLAVVRLQLRALERLQELGDFTDLYAQKYGRLDNGYLAARNQWFHDHPFMTGDELNDYKQITTGGLRKEGTVLPGGVTPEGANQPPPSKPARSKEKAADPLGIR